MIFSVLIAKKSYAVKRYFFVVTMVVGVGFFIFNEDKNKSGEENWIGYVIVGFSLLVDGLMAAAQDKMRSYSRPTTMNFMFYVNGWSSLVLICVMAVTGEGRDLIEFTAKYPQLIWKLAAATAVATVGQIFISATILNFGS